MIEQRIYNLLSENSTIDNLVEGKIYFVLADEIDTEPYIVINIIDIIREYTFTDILDLEHCRIQISCWANSIYDAIHLQNSVLECLDNFSDRNNPSYDEDDTYICVIHSESIGELFDYSAGQNDSKKFGRRLDFTVWYKND
jgi:hypothetical protein